MYILVLQSENSITHGETNIMLLHSNVLYWTNDYCALYSRNYIYIYKQPPVFWQHSNWVPGAFKSSLYLRLRRLFFEWRWWWCFFLEWCPCLFRFLVEWLFFLCWCFLALPARLQIFFILKSSSSAVTLVLRWFTFSQVAILFKALLYLSRSLI